MPPSATILTDAEELQALSKELSKTCSRLGRTADNKLVTASQSARSKVSLTRSEVVLMDAFFPEGGAGVVNSKLEPLARDVKGELVKHAKWDSVFGPVLKRAMDVLAVE